MNTSNNYEAREHELLTARAAHPDFGMLHFERTSQDGRTYYRMMLNGRGGGSLTTLECAELTIAYWNARGWLHHPEETIH